MKLKFMDRLLQFVNTTREDYRAFKNKKDNRKYTAAKYFFTSVGLRKKDNPDK